MEYLGKHLTEQILVLSCYLHYLFGQRKSQGIPVLYLLTSLSFVLYKLLETSADMKVENRKIVVLLEQNQRVTGMTLSKTCWHLNNSGNLKWMAFANLYASECLSILKALKKNPYMSALIGYSALPLPK